MEQLQPKLRFPEFKEDWSKKKLGEVAFFLDGRRKPIKSSDRSKIKGDYPYYGASGIIDYVNDYIFNEEIILLGEDGENIISRNSPLAFKVVGKCWVNNHAHVLKPNENYQIDFLTQILENVSYLNYNTGTAQPKLNQEVCKGIPLILPSLPEQTKIATFLSAVDEKLNLLKEKKQALEDYKKGMMQKIFSQEIRFKDENGKDFADWEEKTLGELAKIRTGKLDANAMDNDGKYRFYTCAKDYFYIDEYAFDTEALLISGNGANVGYIHYYKGKFNAYQRTYVLDEFSDNIQYIKYFLEKFLHKRIMSEKNDGNTPYIVLSTLTEMNILIPNKEEQTKIANFLSAIDEKISLLSEQIEACTEYKKGLLQQLFC